MRKLVKIVSQSEGKSLSASKCPQCQILRQLIRERGHNNVYSLKFLQMKVLKMLALDCYILMIIAATRYQGSKFNICKGRWLWSHADNSIRYGGDIHPYLLLE